MPDAQVGVSRRYEKSCIWGRDFSILLAGISPLPLEGVIYRSTVQFRVRRS